MKILHLENDHIPNKGGLLSYWLRDRKREGAEIKFIGNVYHNQKEIPKNIAWCDVLAFTSTFHYLSSIQDLLQKAILPFRSTPLKIIIEGYEVGENIKRLVEDWAMEWVTEGYDKSGQPTGYFQLNELKCDQTAYALRNFELLTFDDRNELSTITVLQERVKREGERLAFEQQYKTDAIARKTGRKVKIGDLRSVLGKEWSELAEGDIVDEIDMTKLDPRPGWGIWVMGLTEPVKLIGQGDARGYNEYTLINP